MKQIDGKSKIEKFEAKELLLVGRRFDLVIKYLFLLNRENKGDFYKRLYIEHIKSFNNFNEDCGRKRGEIEFIEEFLQIEKSFIENGFDEKISTITVDENYQVIDGAHRVATGAYLETSIKLRKEKTSTSFNYMFFLKKNFPRFLADYTALEYVRMNPKSYIVNLHACNDLKNDKIVESILNKYGFVFYKKNIHLNMNAYISLKKINYGAEHWNEKTFIGSFKDDFQGAKNHANGSFGRNPLRAYVFVCDSLDNVLLAKKEIRDIYNVGNHSVHINDTHAEAIDLAKLFFNDNSIHCLNYSPYNSDLTIINNLVDELKKWGNINKINLEDICVTGSFPLCIYNLRKTNDIDIITNVENMPSENSTIIDIHEDHINLPDSKEEIIYNPNNYFYYRGIKVITLNVLYQYKKRRAEFPKDFNDNYLIEGFNRNSLSSKVKIQKQKIKTEFRLFLINPVKYFYFKTKSILARIKPLRQGWIRLKELSDKKID